ncbi:unnamed protein product [Camellia sinensis]
MYSERRCQLWHGRMATGNLSYGSGCESGCRYKLGANVEENGEDEYLSMVSDASFGPLHFQEDDEEDCFDEIGSFAQLVKVYPTKRLNLAGYSYLTEVLILSRGSVETILWELLRNKEEGYFIASELLRKICLNTKGVEAARNSPALLKRLHNPVEDLTRKTGNEKRNARGQLAREQLERRLEKLLSS